MWRRSARAKTTSQVSNVTPVASQSVSTSSELSPEPVPSTASPAPVVEAFAADSASGAPRSDRSEIAWHLKIDGEIFGDSDLYIDGEVQGRIRIAGGRVTIGPRGSVRADIEAREIVVDGHVEGSLSAVESVRLGASGHVEGKVLAPRVRIDEGAFLRGSVATISPAPAPALVVDAHRTDTEPPQPVPVGVKYEQGRE